MGKQVRRNMGATKVKTSIAELRTLSDSEVYYRIAERVEEWACAQGDFKEALIQKWHMAALSNSNPFLGGN